MGNKHRVARGIDLWLLLALVALVGGYFGLQWLWYATIGPLYQAELGYIPIEEFQRRFLMASIVALSILVAGFLADMMVHSFPPKVTAVRVIFGLSCVAIMAGLIFLPAAETERYHFKPVLEQYAETSWGLAQSPLSEPPPPLPTGMRVAIVDSIEGKFALNNKHRQVKTELRAFRPEQVNVLLFIEWGDQIETTHQREYTVNGPGKTSFTSEHYLVQWQLIDMKNSRVLRRGTSRVESSFDVAAAVPELF